MIFLRYESFRGYLRAYPVTSVIIALNLIYFIVIAFTGDTNSGEHLYNYGAFTSYRDGDPLGLNEPWRYVTSMFMHSGFQHLLFNMFSVLVFAPPLERLLKPLKYAVFYLLCGILGNALSAIVSSLTEEWIRHLAVGASGAIYGVYGAFLFISLFRKAWLDEASRKTVYMILGFGVVYSIVIPSIDLWGHVGGGLAGFLLYGLLDRAMTKKRRRY
ncbi:rhomboid family intramembrane serine protease [Paenibacillus lupini]|jgi:membrane associated rhomboid family serine protease|uniref:rhomboid family intramembrane serine protease n=1 Tax=Paenibacillus lupini TaxID=1450204 RepID=UPI001423E018|nr:rhomboid family intramembrane serine protease [Paenibacillus lupini]NIK20841.1 membrane associated rhomboid family serine protease [Paenibacillus lupini]